MNSTDVEKWRKVNGHYLPGRKYSAYRYNALRRGIEFDLTIDYLDQLWEIQDGKCYYTGVELDITSRLGATGSLDRLDSTVGYVQGNVVWSLVPVNFAKQSLTEDDFLAMVEKIYEYKIKKEAI